MSDKPTMDYGDRDWLQSVADAEIDDNLLSVGRATRIVNKIEQLEAKLDVAHNWVLDNQVHSCSYNQFVKALEQKS